MESFAGLSIDERKLVVGIDFGTTFSALAWAETRRSDHQSVIESWPVSIGTNEGASSVKVPTELRYGPGGIEWGFQIQPPTTPRHKWFKMGLSQGTTSNVDGQQKTPQVLTTDYLTELAKHLMYTLEEKLGAAILRTIPIDFCLTVPAIWSEVAKEQTLKACKKAGLKSQSEILLVSEPEAAAIYALHGLDPHGLGIGDTFVLCDAGGGTVDLISYSITELYPLLKVKEAAAGSGDLCGSTFLNRRFGEFLTGKLGKEPCWDAEILAEAIERFDSVIKKQYSPSTFNQDYIIPVPGIPDNPTLGIRRGRYTMSPSEMNGIFEPVITKVIKLVSAQILSTKKKVAAVLLVGGFGQNNYLKERLRMTLGKSILVLQPPNAWTAVVRGAVMLGLARANSRLASVGLVSRAARKHYGVELRVEFDPDKHEQGKKFFSEKHQHYRVMAMRWFIKKDDPVVESQPSVIKYHQEFLVSDGLPKSADLDIFCDEKSATAPVHRNKKDMRKLVTLEADLSQLTRSELERTIYTAASGEQYYSIDCAIEATFYGASTKYILLCQGKRYDTVTAEYA